MWKCPHRQQSSLQLYGCDRIPSRNMVQSSTCQHQIQSWSSDLKWQQEAWSCRCDVSSVASHLCSELPGCSLANIKYWWIVWQEISSLSYWSVCACVCSGNLRLMVFVPRGQQSGALRLTFAAAALCPLGGNGCCRLIRDKCFHSGCRIEIWPRCSSSQETSNLLKTLGSAALLLVFWNGGVF